MSKRSFPNWYKIAELTVTPKEFQTKHYQELIAIAMNTSITPETQKLFLTEEYDYKQIVLWPLAANPSITPQTQKLFFTEEYNHKTRTLIYLSLNPIFLKGLTPKEMREFTKTNKLPVYRKRFQDVKAMILL